MSQPVDLAALRAVLEKMTSSPWHDHGKPHPEAVRLHKEATGVSAADCLIYWQSRDYGCLPETFERQRADAEGIAVLRNAAPALLTELEQLRHERENLRADLQINDRAVSHANEKRQEAEAELEQLRAQVAILTQERDSWQQAAENRAQDQTILERKLEAVTAELRRQTA